jgi:hypothetical protein
LGRTELVKSRIIALDRLVLVNIEVLIISDHLVTTCASDFKKWTRTHQHLD